MSGSVKEENKGPGRFLQATFLPTTPSDYKGSTPPTPKKETKQGTKRVGSANKGTYCQV